MPKNTMSGWVLIFWILAGLASLYIGLAFVGIKFNEVSADSVPKMLAGVIFVALVIERATEVYINSKQDPTFVNEKIQALEKANAEVYRSRQELHKTTEANMRANRESALAAALEDQKNKTEEANPELTRLARERRKQTTVFGAFLGAIASIVGVRVLGPFVDASEFQTCTNIVLDTDTRTAILQTVEANKDAVVAALEKAKQEYSNLEALLNSTFDTQKCWTYLSQEVWLGAVDVFLTSALLAGGADGIHQIVNQFLKYMKGEQPNGAVT